MEEPVESSSILNRRVAAIHSDDATPTGTAPSPPALDEESLMLTRLFRRCAHLSRSLARTLRQRLISATKPAEQGVAVGALTDLVRGRPALIAENAFLRQQLRILQRSVKRPRCTPTDRALLVLLASRIRAWRQALLIVQPETLLRWHRQGFRLFWRRKSRPRHAPQPRV